jgi:hypothetical protein
MSINPEASRMRILSSWRRGVDIVLNNFYRTVCQGDGLAEVDQQCGPPKSLDLSLLDLLFREYVKESVYTPPPQCLKISMSSAFEVLVNQMTCKYPIFVMRLIIILTLTWLGMTSGCCTNKTTLERWFQNMEIEKKCEDSTESYSTTGKSKCKVVPVPN